jgi:hypothetical protein
MPVVTREPVPGGLLARRLHVIFIHSGRSLALVVKDLVSQMLMCECTGECVDSEETYMAIRSIHREGAVGSVRFPVQGTCHSRDASVQALAVLANALGFAEAMYVSC